MKLIKGILVAFVILLALTMAVGCRKKNPDPPVDRDSEGLVYTSNGDGSCYVSGIGDCKDTEIRIPDKSPEGETVVGIGSSAFEICYGIVSVRLPNSITSIGDNAFYCCSSLETIVLPSGVTSIGASAFCGCEALEAIDIPEGVVSIGSNAFSGCLSLVSITIPSSVKNIGFYAFEYCPSLVEVCYKDFSNIEIDEYFLESGLTKDIMHVIKDGSESYVKRVGDCVFYDDGNEILLVKYLGRERVANLPDYNGKSYKINRYAFNRNDYVVSVKISESVSEICQGAFTECHSLISITIPDSVIAINQSSSVINCSSLMEVCNKTSLPCDFGYRTITDESESCLKMVGDYVFYDDGTEVYLVKYLGKESEIRLPEYNGGENYKVYKSAFYSYNGYGNALPAITSIEIPDYVTELGLGAISFCTELEKVVIGDGLTSVDDGIFGCQAVKYVTLGKNLSSTSAIYDILFDSISLLSIEIDEENPSFKTIDGNVYSKDGKTLIRYAIGKADATLVIPEGVTAIAKKAVNGGNNLTTVILPEGVTTIGESAFERCGGITKLVLPKSVQTVGKHAFINLVPDKIDGNTVHKVYYTGTEEEYKALRRNNLKYENGLPPMAVYDYVIEE